MSFDWSNYLNLAQELAQETSDEAKLRSAISRSYYAAFIKARNFLRHKDNLVIPQQNAHQYVITQFKNSPDRLRQKLGKRLERLRVYRNRADYEDVFSNLVQKAEEALTLARRIISALDGM
ncbi:HEPN domain-containing protein [Floridanema aerugineum]|uniref:HEPN domain-containing protein n=1 Tax=Floridaenema aerugineum BLCC-F46 TaxID=3153654 RepID=A0ABV4X951_9CYAN